MYAAPAPAAAPYYAAPAAAAPPPAAAPAATAGYALNAAAPPAPAPPSESKFWDHKLSQARDWIMKNKLMFGIGLAVAIILLLWITKKSKSKEVRQTPSGADVKQQQQQQQQQEIPVPTPSERAAQAAAQAKQAQAAAQAQAQSLKQRVTQPKDSDDPLPTSINVRHLGAEAQGLEFLSNNGAAGILLLYRDGCGPCKAFKPVFDAAADLAASKGVKVPFARLNMQRTLSPQIFKTYTVNALPTVLLKTASGSVKKLENPVAKNAEALVEAVSTLVFA